VRIERADPSLDKGWFAGRWNSSLDISVGYARNPPDEPHLHAGIHEVYLIARGTCTVRIEQVTLGLRAGDVLIVDPGEAHTFLTCSADYLHFVVHSPGLTGDEAVAQKRAVQRSSLGLGDEPAELGEA
jgi:uncharacterized protein YjlB